MMRKIRFFALAVAVLASSLAAKELEFKRVVGLSLARYSEMPQFASIPEGRFTMKDRILPAFGAGFIYRITPRLSLDVHGQFFKKGAKIDYHVNGERAGRYLYDLRSLSVPICLRYGFLPGSTPYILTGFEISYILSHTEKYFAEGETTGVINKLLPSTRKIDFCSVLGGGYEFIIGRHAYFFEVRWYAGLVNISRSVADYPDIKSRTLAIQVGYRTSRRPFPFS